MLPRTSRLLLVLTCAVKVVFGHDPVSAADVVLANPSGMNAGENRLLDLGLGQLTYLTDETQKHPIKITAAPIGVAGAEGLALDDEIVAINNVEWSHKAEAVAMIAKASAVGRFDLTLTRGVTVRLISGKEQDRVFKLLGLDLKDSGDGEVAIAISTDKSLQAGLRVDDRVLLLDGDVFKPAAIMKHKLAQIFLSKSEVTLRIQSVSGERINVTLPPLSAAAQNNRPLLTRGISSQGTGPRVDFPLALGPGEEPSSDIHGDRRRTRANEIVSARVELYYFRDAHRVAQILNRKVQSFNGTAVTQHERAAESAREQFEEQRLDRRQLEVEALQSATELQDLEADLVRHVGALRAELERQQPPPAKPNNGQQALTTEASKPADLASFRTNVETALKNVQAKRIEALKKQAAADRSNDQEQLAAKERFRREVSAAKVDPDTYVAGEKNSIDPVAQVSISVIGEGVLHLRGPRLGVTKIRYMIDQIDHPVGQVKIGVMTLQVNGENGHRMENTLRRLEGNISRARFLAYVSAQLFQRALVETANKVAVESAGLPLASLGPAGADCSPEQRLRWQRYLEAFFGRDFLDELRDVDPNNSLLDPRHKLLAISSMDTVTLGEALVMIGLAKHTIRNEILTKLQHFLECDLPEKETNWILTNKLYHHKDPRWWGDAYWGRVHTYENAVLRYKFTAIRTFYERNYEHGELAADVLNPLQRQVIKLVQGISLEQALNLKRDNSTLKRSLVDQQQAINADGVGMTGLQRYYLDQQIDELEEQHLDAVESLRGQKAAIDKLIKSVIIAMEDDVDAQYYNPALERIRTAAREWDVELSAIERTTILTNNRAFGKVSPQASYEFDLPRRDILVVEALKSAYALQKDLGPLLADPNFTMLTKMMSNSPLNGDSAASIKNILPGLPSDTDQKDLLFGDSTAKKHFGTELEKLVPDPAIYKFETGTGYEVRPVVQPDGQSVAFDFNYMYTTDLLEPVRANEKHLGRIKRHFINTEVQLGNLEWREISRYEVALKAARNARGVPLLEDIPGAGVLFRPLPQAQKSIQKNIIIGQASIYPTIQDLLGLKPANLCHVNINLVLSDARSEATKNAGRMKYVNDTLNNRIDVLLGGRAEIPDASLCPRAADGTIRFDRHSPVNGAAPSAAAPYEETAPASAVPLTPGQQPRGISPDIAPGPTTQRNPSNTPLRLSVQPTTAPKPPRLTLPPTTQNSAPAIKDQNVLPAGFEQPAKKSSRGGPAGKSTRSGPDAAPPTRRPATLSP